MTSSAATGLDAGRQQAAATADDRFGVDLYQQLRTGQPNLVFSPASIAAALQLALVGARGRTATQLAAALRLNRSDPATNSDPARDADLATRARDGLLLLSAAVDAGQTANPGASPEQALIL